MIYDTRENMKMYKGLGENLDRAIAYFLKTDFSKLEAGKYPIDEDRVFALVQTPTTYPKEKARWESHEKYIDIQYLLNGEEMFGLQKTDQLTVSEPYREENDITFFEDNGKGFFPILRPDTFVICFPTDAHMPLIRPHEPMAIKKVVIKVKTESCG
ncbi:MAG TPA: DUF386 domain-containing protein [Clostridiales bacterium]|nr:DUF386 domain-containing protein [Clostridiales bacterium]